MDLSIVVPAVGSQAEIDSTVLSILENRPQDCEVLLVHRSCYVDPYQLEDEVRLIESQGNSRLELLNDGFRYAQGRVVHALSPGLSVTDHWCVPALDEFYADGNLASVSPGIRVANKKTVLGVAYRASDGRRLVTGKRFARQASKVLGPCIEAGFYLRTALKFMHGFRPGYGPLADVDLGLRIRAANYRTVSQPEIQIKADRLTQVDPLKGYKGGQVRGRLHQLAKAQGLSSSIQGILAMLGEPLRNGIGPGIVTGLLGRYLATSAKSTGQIHQMESQQSSQRERKAA